MKNLFTYKNNIASGLKRYGKFLLLAISLLFLSNTAWAGFYLWGYDTNSPQMGNGNATVVAQEMMPTDNTNTVYKISLDGRKSYDYCFFISTNDSKDFTTAYGQRLTINTFTGNSYLSLNNYGNFDKENKIYHVSSNNNLVITISYLTETATLDATSTEPTPDPEPDPEPDPDPSGTKPSIRIGKQPVVIDNKDVDLNFQLADWGCSEVTKVKVYYTTDGSEPTESSQVVELTTSQNGNNNFTLTWKNVPSGNYNIKAVACNASGCGAMSDKASFVTQCDNPAAPIVDKTEATLCQGAEEQFTITNYTSELTYKVFKNGIETDIVITDGKFTLLESGEYVVKVKNNCSNYIPSETINVVVNSKPAAPTIFNSNRKSCTLQNVSYKIAEGNNVIITMNEGTSTTAPAPVDGNEYEGETVPATIANDLANVEDLAVDPTKDYTLTCYQYNAASLCYSEPVTFYIPKNLAIITEVEVSNVTRITADVTVTANAGPVLGTAVAELYLEWRVKGSGDAWTGGSPNIVANPVYQITMLTEGTTYEVRAKAKNNSGCDGNGFGYSEIVEFTTKTCPVLTIQTVTGVNTIGKVQATITMASSQTDAIYQLFIGDTPIDGSVQEGTGEALTWQVNQTGLYYVKGWFKEAPDYCANGATIMGEYDLNCTQAPTPVISIDKNTICSNGNATISVKAVEGVTYQLYKDGDLVSDKNITKDGEFTGLTAAGNYTVVATTKDICQATATSQIITLTVIDASASVTINPTTDTTTPWVPVDFTVTSTAGAPYTLVYKDAAGNDVTDQMVVVKKGNSYSLKIPRPATAGWKPGNSTDPVATTTYTVEASLDGQASCGSTSTLTITLNDTYEICE